MPGGTSFPLLAIFVILLNIAFWGAIVAVSVSLVKRNSDQPSNNHVKPAAVDVLEQRYARGEISHQEFIERRAVLMDEPPESPSTSSGTGPRTESRFPLDLANICSIWCRDRAANRG